jgi:hypothetical protein
MARNISCEYRTLMTSEKLALKLAGAGGDFGGCESDDGRKGLLGARNFEEQRAAG